MKKNSKPSTSELRRQAEGKLSGQKQAAQPEQGVDIPRLVHELQVRQIELEIQNEELIQARAELEAVLRQYTDLYDFAPIGYFTLTREGAICQVNQAGANLLGVKHNELTQHHFGIFVSNESLPAYNVFFEQLLTGQGKINCELAFEKKGGGVLWGRIEATCFEGGEMCRAMLTDITERTQMDQALQESENRFRIILQDVSTIAVQGYAIDGTTQYWNLASAKLYGYSAQEAIGRNLLDLIIPPEMRSGVSQAIQNMAKTGEPIPAAELSLIRKDGSRVTVYSSHTMVSIPGRTPEFYCMDIDLTERKQAEELLKESEWRNRIISELTTDYIFVVDVEAGGTLRIRWASDNFHLLTGRKIEDAATSDLWGNIIHPDHKVRFFDFVNQVLSTAEADKIECRTISLHGGERWVRIFVRPQVLEENKVTTIIGAVEDISERKRVEDALRESEEKFRSLVEQSTDGVILIDEQGIIIEWNTAESKITGIPRTNALGATVWDIQHQIMMPERRVKLTPQYLKKTYFESYLGGKAGFSEKPRDIEIVSLSGEHKFLQQTSFIIKTEKGHRMGTVIRDITERKQAEEALRVSEERFRLLANNIPDIIYSLNGEGNIVTINSSAFERYGYTEQDAKGKPFLSFIHPEDCGIVITSFLKALEEQRKFTHGLQFRIVAENGTHYWFELNSQAHYDSHAQYIGEDGVLRDITERKRVEDALHESEARNRAMVDALPDLIFVQDRAGVYLDYRAKMSHLLITPPEFFLGRSTREILPPDQAEAFQQKSYLAFQTGEIQIHEYVLELEDGIHHFEARMNAYDNDRLLSIVREITERKLAEVELQYTKVGLEKANKELQTALIREKELAHTDALTGINNRRYLYELAEHEFEIALRYQRPLSILMFDIDHFKQVNDTFGHTAGDHILQQVTQVTRAKLRSADVIGRYGGEEFVIVLPMTNAQQAYPLAERIRLAAEAIRVPTEKGDATITLSIGIVEIQQGTQQTGSVESLIRRADEVMYAAKQAGRNRTEIGD